MPRKSRKSHVTDALKGWLSLSIAQKPLVDVLIATSACAGKNHGRQWNRKNQQLLLLAASVLPPLVADSLIDFLIELQSRRYIEQRIAVPKHPCIYPLMLEKTLDEERWMGNLRLTRQSFVHLLVLLKDHGVFQSGNANGGFSPSVTP